MNQTAPFAFSDALTNRCKNCPLALSFSCKQRGILTSVNDRNSSIHFLILFCVDVSIGSSQSSASIHNFCINAFALRIQETNGPKESNSLTTSFRNFLLLLVSKPVKFFLESMGRHLFTADYTCFRTTFMTKSNAFV